MQSAALINVSLHGKKTNVEPIRVPTIVRENLHPYNIGFDPDYECH